MHEQSSLVLRFVNDDFQENKEPTIGGMHTLPLSINLGDAGANLVP